MKTWLLIDNSNGRTKLALARAGELLTERAVLPTAELNPAALQADTAAWSVEAVAVCSVVPAAAAIIRKTFENCGELHFLSAATAPAALGVDFSAYPGAATLGADRVANILALAAEDARPALALDAGTAVTYDVLTRNAAGSDTFAGGIIAPGLSALRDYLHERTAALPRASRAAPARSIGQSTAEAMQSGLHHGFCGMVRESLTAIAAELGQRPRTIATGGDAERLRDLLPELIDAADPLLTLKGLARAAAAWEKA